MNNFRKIFFIFLSIGAFSFALSSDKQKLDEISVQVKGDDKINSITKVVDKHSEKIDGIGRKIDNELININFVFDELRLSIAKLNKRIDGLGGQGEGAGSLSDSTIKEITQEYSRIKDNFVNLSLTILNNKALIDKLDKEASEKYSSISENIKTISSSVDKIEKDTQEKYSSMRADISKMSNMINSIDGSKPATEDKMEKILLVALLVVLLLLLFNFYKTYKNSKLLAKNKRETEELRETMGTQHKAMIELFEKQISSTILAAKVNATKEDHVVILDLVNEVTKLQHSIDKIISDEKESKRLLAAIERIYANLSKNSYEIVNHIGSKYDEDMEIDVVNLVKDLTLSVDEKVVTKVIRHQINFNDEVIQVAQVEVSCN